MPDPKPIRQPIRRGEVETPKEFFSRLKQPDAITVKAIIESVKSLAEGHILERGQREAFFAVYGIAGNITKSGDRPDVDLLVVTNAVWTNGYQSENPENRSILYKDSIALSGDWVAGTLRDVFEKEDYKVRLMKTIPNEYSKVGANLKGMIRLMPNNEGRKPIDIVIVNSTSLKNKEIRSLEKFEEIGDVDKHGKPLPRVLLFKT